MPRTRKPRPGATAEPEDDDAAQGGQRPSQLDQIRDAMSKPAKGAGPDELPAPQEEPELPAHEEAPELPAPEASGASQASAAEVTADAAPAATAALEPTAAAPVTSPWVPPPTSPPPVPAPPPRPAGVAGGGRPGSSSLALGIVLVVVGFFFLVMRLFDIDLSSYGWPLYVIIPGITLLVVGFISLGTGALVPGGIITMAGLVLAYQNATGDWASWSYAWALVLPGGVGVGLLLQSLRVHDPRQMKTARSLIFWAVMIFLIGFVFFESILDVSGIDYGVVGRAALPVLLIVIGVTLLARSWQRSRSA